MSLPNLATIAEKDLKELCDQGCPESQTLDFKELLPDSSDRGKKELLKDVCALANADGGDLVYGVSEDSGKAGRLTPIIGEAPDAARRRLSQVLDAGMEPRVVGLQFREFPAAGGGYVLVLRVPASFIGPHRFVFNNVSRFVMRTGTHTVDLTYDQLRSAFDRTATLAERARRFRDERMQTIAAGKAWRPVLPGPICTLHGIPISAMSGAQRVDVRALHENYQQYIFRDWPGATRALNLDGLVIYPATSRDDNMAVAFATVFRTGAFEAVRAGSGGDPQTKVIPSMSVSVFFRDAIDKFLSSSRRLGIAGPAVVGAAMLSVEGYEFAVGPQFFHFDRVRADRQHLVLPEAWVDAVESFRDVDAVARPMLDVLWQAFDIEQCTLYDEKGVWKPK